MSVPTITRFLLLGIVLFANSVPSYAQDKFRLDKNDTVIFAGGANMLHLQKAGYLEAILTRKFASAEPKFRDWSWETDTVFRQGSVIERWRKDGFGDRDDQIKRLGATVVIAQFGRLESLAGPEELEPFTNAYNRLIDSFQAQAKTIVLVTPTPFEKPTIETIPDLSKRNEDLALYVKAITNIAKERKLVLVDLSSLAQQGLTDNGMHIKPAAQSVVAQEIARQLGVDIPTNAELEPLRLAVIEKHRLWYDYWRPANWKLLYGDDSRRQFTRGGNDYIPFKEEWQKLLPLIELAEQRVWLVARGGKDTGHNRPKPEVLHGDPSADIKQEIASFTVPDGMQVNLFASEKEGLTSPLAIRWDATGRMYVTVTTTYPHVFPGDIPNDKIIVLEDTNNDGTADKSSLFAEGLNIPTGLELGDGGVYVGQNTELLFLKDTDGDGKADTRRVVLGGLGNGDSHQTCNSFVWSPGGELFFGQGDGCESRVETPWGAANLFQSGFYRFRPRRLQLHPLLDDFMGPGNPWGVAFDEWGQIFSIDGAGGVTFLSQGLVPTSHRLKIPRIGNPGGYCGISYLDGRHLPEALHGDFVVGDFKANRIKRFGVKNNGSGFSLEWKEHLLQSKHRNFRPVDVRQGPDGAIYIVDWYNPITCHQDDAYRHPTRDKAHGRIWRVSSKIPSIKPPNLSKAPLTEVLNGLKSPEHWTRYQAKRVLTQRNPAAVAKALTAWVQTLDPTRSRYEHHLYEALGAAATVEVVAPGILDRLLQAKDYRARAYATRMVGRWHDRLDDPLELLSLRIADEHPQVRLEAVMACAAIPSPRAIEVAARVGDMPMDRPLTYAFTQTAHHLKSFWSPAFHRGDVSFARPSHLAAVLNITGGRDILNGLREIADSNDQTPQNRASAIAAIISVGGPTDMERYGLDTKRFTLDGKYDAVLHADVLTRLVNVARNQSESPTGELSASLNHLLEQASSEVQTQALVLAGIWKVDGTQGRVLAIAKDGSQLLTMRAAAFLAMAEMKVSSSRELLVGYAAKPNSPALRAAAIEALVMLDAPLAASLGAELFEESVATSATVSAFLHRKGGAEELANALRTTKIEPQSAEHLLRALYATGRSDEALVGALNQAIGVSGQVPEYSEEYVNQLVAESKKHGNVERGAALFRTRACITCHKVGNDGGMIGPNLSAIGTTLSSERIVEELLWPNRQVKEGYSVVRVLTDEGVLVQGYERRSKESQQSGDLLMRELASEKLITIKKQNVDEMRTTGSPMPTGLTALLTRPQMLDLIRYVSEMGKIE